MIFTGKEFSPIECFQHNIPQLSGLLMEDKSGIYRFMGNGYLDDVI